MGGGGFVCLDEIMGIIMFIEVGFGDYEVLDVLLGVFGFCWGDNFVIGVNLVDVCNIICFIGVDQYGDSYIWIIIDILGFIMIVDFENIYGDGGIFVLICVDGVDWLLLVNQINGII